MANFAIRTFIRVKKRKEPRIENVQWYTFSLSKKKRTDSAVSQMACSVVDEKGGKNQKFCEMPAVCCG
jgi:hypothetical protein